MKKQLLEALKERVKVAGIEQSRKEHSGAMFAQAFSKAQEAKRKGNVVTPEELVSKLNDEPEYLEVMAGIGIDRNEILRIAETAIEGAEKVEVSRNAPKKQDCPVCRKRSKRISINDDGVVYKCPKHGEFTRGG